MANEAKVQVNIYNVQLNSLAGAVTERPISLPLPRSLSVSLSSAVSFTLLSLSVKTQNAEKILAKKELLN